MKATLAGYYKAGGPEAEFMERGLLPGRWVIGNQIQLPNPQALMRGPSRSRMWPLKVAPASHPPEYLDPQRSHGGQPLRLRIPCFRLQAQAVPWPPERDLSSLGATCILDRRPLERPPEWS